MTTIITTLSGTTYVVHDGNVTRYGTAAVYDCRDGSNHASPVGDAIVGGDVATVGVPWRFRTAAGPFVTTPVVAVKAVA